MASPSPSSISPHPSSSSGGAQRQRVVSFVVVSCGVPVYEADLAQWNVARRSAATATATTPPPLADASASASASAIATAATQQQQHAVAHVPAVDPSHLHQFVMHAACDAADDALWHEAAAAPPLAFGATAYGGAASSSGAVPLALRLVDRFNDLSVTAHVTAGRYKMLLLHDARISEEAATSFMRDVHEPLVKVMLNPLREAAEYIACPKFDERVRSLAKRHLSS